MAKDFLGTAERSTPLQIQAGHVKYIHIQHSGESWKNDCGYGDEKA